MKRGKKICKTLKDIRREIAKANDIEYEPRECKHEGDCMGTCPACEAEVRYLERQLDLRRKLGKAVAVVGISAGLAGLAACGSKKAVASEDIPHLQGDPVAPPPELAGIPMIPTTVIEANVDTAKACATTMKEEIFGDISETMPMFRGGNNGLKEYIRQNLRYPMNFEDSIQGRVIVTFTINEDGSLSDAKITKSLHEQLDAEALRLVNEMPKWVPARRLGKAVKVKYTLPVTFTTE
jgi:TonB family protein